MLLQSLQDLDLRACVGWALFHSIWQGFIAWSLYTIVCLGNVRPTFRYRTGNACLLAFVVAQLATVTYCAVSHVRPDLLDGLPAFLRGVDRIPVVDDHYLVPEMPHAALWSAWAARAERYLRWVCLLWALGLAYRSFLTIGAMVLLEREVRRCVALTEPWRARALHACEQLKFSRPVRFLECARLTVPATAGWLKPVILLPTSMLANLAPDHVEALVMHELVHIARLDYLANLLRSALDSIYFFHPLIRRMTRRLVEDAEESTDEVAAEACGSKKTYAAALVTLNERRAGQQLLLGADGGSLKARLVNLLANRGVARRGHLRLSAAAPLVTALVVVFLCSQSLAVAAADRNLSERARSLTFPQAVIAALSQDRVNPAAEAALAKAVSERRSGGRAKAQTLRVLATELLSGMSAESISTLKSVPETTTLAHDIAPAIARRFGTRDERGGLVRQLLAMAAAEPAAHRAARRNLTRAAVCLACLCDLHGGPQNAGRILTTFDRIADLDLTAAERRRIDLALRAQSERVHELFTALIRIQKNPSSFSDPQLMSVVDLLSRMPDYQTLAARSMPLSVHRRLVTLLQSPRAAPAGQDTVRVLRVSYDAVLNPDDFVMAEIRTIHLRKPGQLPTPVDARDMPRTGS